MSADGILSRLTRANLLGLSIAVLLFTALIVTDYLTTVTILVAGAVILAYLLLGPVHFIEILILKSSLAKLEVKLPWVKKPVRLSAGGRRTVAILTVYLLGLVLVGALLFRIIPPLMTQLGGFVHDLPVYIERAEANRSPVQTEPVPESFSELLSGALTEEEATPVPSLQPERTPRRMARATSTLLVKKAVELLQEYASRIGAALLNVGTTTLTGLIYFLTALVMVFYLLHDGRLLKERFVAILPAHSEDGASRYLERLHLQFFTFLKGQVVISILWATMMYLLLLLLGVKYSLLLSIFFGLSTILPVIGPWFGMIPIALVTLLSDHPIYFAQVLVFNGVFYLLKAYWLWPRLIHHKYDVHPVVFILAFLVCLQVVGYAGILLSFPLASVIGATTEYLRTRNQAA